MAVTQQGHIFIDPENCGSSVGYHLNTNEYTRNKKTEYSLSATVVLTDCARKIEWDFGPDNLAKIDAAITQLQKFRKEYFEMDNLVKKLNEGR